MRTGVVVIAVLIILVGVALTLGGGGAQGQGNPQESSDHLSQAYDDHQRRASGLCRFVPTRADPLPKLLDGVQNLESNPYGNPMPYDAGVPFRSKKCSVVGPPLEDTCLARMYKGTSEWDPGFFFNTVPDTTLMAREVFWPQDPAPDIVSRERDVTVLNRRV